MKQNPCPAAGKCSAYEEQFNIPLFNAAVQLAITTTEAPKRISNVQNTLCDLPWYEKADSAAFFEPYSIRYVGELLERYGEKLGDTPENTRALALALAWTAPILTPNMFVGNQRASFMKAILKKEKNDVYIAVSLCLLSEGEEKEARLQALLNRTYQRTEEMIFFLCSMERAEPYYEHILPLLTALLGKGRTLTAADSGGIFGWLLERCAKAIKGCRKKDNALMRALFALAKGYVREKDAAYDVLLQAGYSKLDILYLNSLFVWDRRLQYYHAMPDSIPAEKLAAAFVLSCMNAEVPPDDSMLEYAAWLLERYQEYKIKYEGNSGMRMALAKAVHVVCPEIMVWMLRDLEWKDSLPFDALVDRWDALARELPKGKYHEVFREQVEHQKELTAETFRAWLQKYEALSGSSYMDTFRTFSYDEEDIFAICVRFGAVSLWDFFNEHKDEQDTRYQYSPLRYVWDMVSGVKTRPAFDFWQSFFSTFEMRQLRSFFQDKSFHEGFSSASRGIYGYSNHKKEVRYQRAFLTREENRRLYEWIDESVFLFAPSDYDDMVFAFLTAPETLELYDRAELRPIFDFIQERKPNHSDIPALKRVFLSAEELEAERQAEEERKQRKKLAEAEAEKTKTCKEMDERFDGTLESIMKYLDRCFYSSAKRYAVQHAVCLLAGILLKRRTFTKKEFGTLLELMGTLVQYDEMKQADVLNTLNEVTMLEEEDANHADDD